MCEVKGQGTGAARTVRWLASFLWATGALAALTGAASGQERHALHVSVVDTAGRPIPRAEVFVTIAPTAEVVTGVTDTSGRAEVAITGEQATGEYLVLVVALGYRPFRQRVTVAVNGNAVDVRALLTPQVATMTGVRVQATRTRPPATLGQEAGVPVADGLNRRADGVANAVPPDQQGELTAVAALVPGLGVTPAGISAFGLPSEANQTTINGSGVAISALPRDLPAATYYLTSPWDPTRGGFSGVLVASTILSGANIRRQRAHLTADHPRLQVGDPVGARFGQQFRGLQASMGGSGPLVLERYFYSFGLDARIRQVPVGSLLSPGEEALKELALSRDSLLALTRALGQLGVPTIGPPGAASRTTKSVQFVERIDRVRPGKQRNGAPHPTAALTIGADYMASTSVTLSPTVFPSSSGELSAGGAFAQGQYVKYGGKDGGVLTEAAAVVTIHGLQANPYSDTPTGRVLVGTSAGPGGLMALAFGGHPALDRRERDASVELTSQTSFLLKRRVNWPAKVNIQLRHETALRDDGLNRRGTFDFPSLDALSRGEPSRFSRILADPAQPVAGWGGAVAAGGNWATRKVILTGGVRVDADHVSTATPKPVSGSALLGSWGTHTANYVGVSPRLGFNWYPTAERGPAQYSSPVATTYRTGYQVRGGIGVFRGRMSARNVADALYRAGRGPERSEVSCVGDAAPRADWAVFEASPDAVPTTCRPGYAALADSGRTATALSPGFRLESALRSTLGWTRTIAGHYIAVDLVYDRQFNLRGIKDLNFSDVERFTLSNEGQRPVFVPTTSVVPTTGAVSDKASRVDPQFGRVIQLASDLRGEVRQAVLYLVPRLPRQIGSVMIGYTYSHSRRQYRGFDGESGRDPSHVEWASWTTLPTHQTTLQLGRLMAGGNLAFTLYGRLSSGTRYTPVVSGDINGDGVQGDRAFVFDPRTADSTRATGLASLLANAKPRVRECLLRQVGQIAARNSCTGSWSAIVNASLFMPKVPRTDSRVQATLAFSNPLAAIDRLLHGAAGVRGWGSQPVIDGSLYQIRGFDSEHQRFSYSANPRFGSTAGLTGGLRAPFRVALDVRVELGRSADEQRLEQSLRITPSARGTRATVDSVQRRFAENAFGGMYQSLLRLSDSLALSRAQIERLQERDTVLRTRVDSIYRVAAEELVGLPADYRPRDAVKRLKTADNSAWEAIYSEASFLRRLLSPGQVHLLPPILRVMLTAPNFSARFFF